MQSLSYDQLTTVLKLSSVRELEDLVIESVYLGLVSGKLNQAKKVFEVAETAGRDVRPEDVASMLAMLTSWQKTSSSVMHSIHERIQSAEEEHAQAASAKTKREKETEEKFNTIRAVLEADPDGRKGAAVFDEQAALFGLMGGNTRKNKGRQVPRGGHN